MKCPECFSENLIKFGKKFARDKGTGKRVKKPQFQCKDCGRITVNPL